MLIFTLASDWPSMLTHYYSMLGAPIDLSYDLADGPFRIYGIDVKDAYKMAQRLYNLLKDLKDAAEVCEEIAAIMAELAEFAGIADIAGDIFAGVRAY